MPPNAVMDVNQKEEAMDVALEDGFTVVTGGAEGTHALVESCARQWGMQVELKIPPGHRRVAAVTPVSKDQLYLADPFVQAAATCLIKQVPHNAYSANRAT